MAGPAGERRIVSVLLADIADSTAIGERLGPERSKFLFDEVTRLLAAEVKRFGGTIAQLTGDGLYALFGVPDAHEDDAERAVRAALAMQAVLAGYAKDVLEAYGLDLAGRVGVNTGPVVLLPDEAPPEERFNALGDTVNTAARLQSEAGRGGVAVGPDTARQVEASFELEPVGPLVLKGKADPVERLETATLLPQNWAPGHGYDILSWGLGPNLFRGLLRFERGLDVVPDVAERMFVSADGCTYVFRLRDGLRWNDGEPLTAEDFAFTHRAMREQAVNTAHFLEGIEADARHALTLEVRLSEPRAHMLYLFAQLPLFPWPRHKVEALEAAWKEERPLVGNGPFVLTETGDERAVLAINRNWTGSHGNVCDVTISVLDPYEARDGWSAGRFDFVHLPSMNRVDDHDTVVIPVPHLGIEYIGLPAHPPFDDERVRRALARGLDRPPLVEGFVAVPAYGGFLPPAMPGHSHDIALDYDVERARTLLAEAGYPDGSSLPELRLVHPDPGYSPEFRADIAARWEPQWRELGVRVRQDWVEFERLEEESKVGPSFWELGWVSDYSDPQGMLESFLGSTELIRDEELVELLERARSVRARDERLELYRAVDRRLVAERVWVIPAFYDRWDLWHRPFVEGLWAGPQGIAPLEGVVVRR